jgi:hypothetical protein
VLEMFGLNCFRVRTKSLLIAVLKYCIKGAQLVACLMIYVSHAYFYVSRSILSKLRWFFTYLSVFCDVASKINYSRFIFKYNSDFSMVMIKQKKSNKFMAEYRQMSVLSVIT